MMSVPGPMAFRLPHIGKARLDVATNDTVVQGCMAVRNDWLVLCL